MRTCLARRGPMWTMTFSGSTTVDLITGLVAQMQLVSAVVRHAGKDPGRPPVQQFGRDLYYSDLSKLIPPPKEVRDCEEYAKYEVLGARWPSVPRLGSMRRALESFKAALEQQEFRALVFDYDGTLCTSHTRDNPPKESVVKELRRLSEGGVILGIASG